MYDLEEVSDLTPKNVNHNANRQPVKNKMGEQGVIVAHFDKAALDDLEQRVEELIKSDKIAHL